jgi:hypothetical protein
LHATLYFFCAPKPRRACHEQPHCRIRVNKRAQGGAVA